jgi:hypothetical protein
MAITFPRAIPSELSDRLSGLTFTLKPMLEISPLRSGRQIALDIGPNLWLGEWRSEAMDATKMGVARAWFDTLSSIQEFYGYDQYRQYPLAYANTGFLGGFTGTCTLTSVTLPYTIVLGSLPAGFILSPGDYLSFDYTSGTTVRALHRVSEGGTASGGGSLTIEVRPAVRSGFAGGATVTVFRASARMIVLPESYSENINASVGSISFKAIQTL